MKKFTFALFLVVHAACVQAQELGKRNELLVRVGTHFDVTDIGCDPQARWARHKRWNFYSRQGLAPMMAVHSSNAEHTKVEKELGNQLSPLAVEVGNDNIRGFLELGFGVQGIVNVGLSHHF